MHKSYVPDTPYLDNRVISTRISPEFHKQLRQFAADKDCAVAAIVKTALEVYLGNRAH